MHNKVCLPLETMCLMMSLKMVEQVPINRTYAEEDPGVKMSNKKLSSKVKR